MSREVILKNYIDMIRDRYDWGLIDCMPSLGMMTINALVAADEVIIPVQTAYLPVKGLSMLLSTIAKVKKMLNRDLKVRGIVLTMVDFRTNYAKDIAEMIRETYGSKVGIFKSVIPSSVKAAEASSEGISIYKHCPNSKDYKGLDIMDRVGGGDSFASGLIYGLMTTQDPELAVNYGAAHGALAMTTPGDTTMASKKEVEAIKDASINIFGKLPP